MNLEQAMAVIRSKQTVSVYLLFGEETYLTSQFEQALLALLLPGNDMETGLTRFDSDPSPDSLARLLETSPFFSARNVVVLRGTAAFRAKKGSAPSEEEEEKTDDAKPDDNAGRLLAICSAIPDYSHLIFIAHDKVDKRKKLFKWIEKNGLVVEATPLKAKDIQPWISLKMAEMDRRLAPDALRYLLSVISIMPQISLAFLAGELEKAALYAYGRDTITLADVQAVLADIPEVSAFAMLDEVCRKDTAKAVSMLHVQLSGGEYPLRLAALLARQIRMLWQVRILREQGLNNEAIAAELGVPPFVADKLLRQSHAFTVPSLQQGLRRLAAADADLKNGRADMSVLEQIVIEICE